MTVTSNSLKFNKATAVELNYAPYIKVLLNAKTRQIAIQPCLVGSSGGHLTHLYIRSWTGQRSIPDWEIKFSGSIRRAAMLVWKQFLSGISGTRSSYGECMTAFAECSAGKHGKAAAFGQNTHISVLQRQMFVKLLSILQPCNVHGFCL